MTESLPGPAVDRDKYHCVNCSAFAHHRAMTINGYPMAGGTGMKLHRYRVHHCVACNQLTMWFLVADGADADDPTNWRLVHPLVTTAMAAHPEMPAAVKTIYEEARQVSAISGRSAAALLRLGLQHLIDAIEPGTANINSKIQKLVDKGLHADAQKAMDVLRVVGNDAVHPGQIQVNDEPETVSALFMLINLVVEQVISRPNRLAELYAALPQSKLAQIQQRGGNTQPATP